SEAATGAVVRLEKQPLKADQPVAQSDLGREIVVTDGLRLPVPRRIRLTADHVGKPLGAVLGEAWRTDEAAMQGVLDQHSYVVTAHRLDPDASFANGRAYALLDRALPVLDGPLHGDIVYAENKGAAFSFLESAPPMFRWGLFVAVSSIASLVMIWWLARGVLFSALSAWSLAAILAGAMGNLVDRARYTVVIDFIYNYILVDGRVVGWPVYNVADIGITVGVILIALESLLRKPAAIAPAAS
ncbi:MAG: signal peptidase II, partial [Deltaproteobacteria bacterium]|nr:signal peptidase II [Deltaproteobacteria bacterium]